MAVAVAVPPLSGSWLPDVKILESSPADHTEGAVSRKSASIAKATCTAEADPATGAAERPAATGSSDGGTGGPISPRRPPPPQPSEGAAGDPAIPFSASSDVAEDNASCVDNRSSPGADAQAQHAAEGGDISWDITGTGEEEYGRSRHLERDLGISAHGGSLPQFGCEEAATKSQLACSRSVADAEGAAELRDIGDGGGSGDAAHEGTHEDANGGCHGCVPRVLPGHALKPAPTRRADVFDRLHAQHARKLERIASLKERALRDEEEQAEALRRTTLRLGSVDEAERATSRLYNDAANRRRRSEMRQLEKEQQEQRCLEEQQMEITLLPRSRSAMALSDGAAQATPRWERLYNVAPDRERRLELERRRAAEEEERSLQALSVHKAALGVREGEGAHTFERLYNDSLHRDIRLVQLQAFGAEEESRRILEGSVHRSVADKSSAETVEECTRRLHEESRRRMERLEGKRKKAEDAEAAAAQNCCPTVSAATIEECTRRLHEESQRRVERLEEKRRRAEMEEAERIAAATPRPSASTTCISADDCAQRSQDEHRRRLERWRKKAMTVVDDALTPTTASSSSSSSGIRAGGSVSFVDLNDEYGTETFDTLRENMAVPTAMSNAPPYSARSRRPRVIRRADSSSSSIVGVSAGSSSTGAAALESSGAREASCPATVTHAAAMTSGSSATSALQSVRRATPGTRQLAQVQQSQAVDNVQSAASTGKRRASSTVAVSRSARGPSGLNSSGISTVIAEGAAAPRTRMAPHGAEQPQPGTRSSLGGEGFANPAALRSSSQLLSCEATVLGQLLAMTAPSGVSGVFAAWDAEPGSLAQPVSARKTVRIEPLDRCTSGVAFGQEARTEKSELSKNLRSTAGAAEPPPQPQRQHSAHGHGHGSLSGGDKLGSMSARRSTSTLRRASSMSRAGTAPSTVPVSARGTTPARLRR